MKVDKVLFFFSSVHKTQYVVISLGPFIVLYKVMLRRKSTAYCTVIELVP